MARLYIAAALAVLTAAWVAVAYASLTGEVGAL